MSELHDKKRLIEVAFPLKQASLDSVREKYGPRGHISGFHLWISCPMRAKWRMMMKRDPEYIVTNTLLWTLSAAVLALLCVWTLGAVAPPSAQPWYMGIVDWVRTHWPGPNAGSWFALPECVRDFFLRFFWEDPDYYLTGPEM